jgi:hypothetical protein
VSNNNKNECNLVAYSNVIKCHIHCDIDIMYFVTKNAGYAVAQLVEALRYKSEGRGLHSRSCHWNSGRTMALGSTQRLNRDK